MPSSPHDRAVDALTPDELRRYSRHLTLPEIGEAGQRRLAAAKVLLIGAGGLGSSAALYLAAAGVGNLGIVDDDVVDESNLQRQILHGTADVGRPKTESARARIADVNPHVRVQLFATRFVASNALEIMQPFDMVVDGTDNFRTRYLVNDACVLSGKLNVHGSVSGFEGRVSVFATADGPCYRCLYPEPPPQGLVPSCAEAGVLGVVPGMIGVLQAAEAIKLIVGAGRPLVGQLLVMDILEMRFRTIAVSRDPACPACGTRSLGELREIADTCEGGAASAALSVPSNSIEISPAALALRLAHGKAGCVELIDVREPWEHAIVRLPGARLIPLGTLDHVMGDLDASRETVVYCHHGIRSLHAAERLRAAGFARVTSLAGGIERWGMDVDPTLPRY